MRERYERTYGALLGLALGDALGYPALFHRIFSLAEKRRPRIWDNNRKLTEQRIGRLYLPYTHRQPSELLEPAPSDDTEWALLSAKALIEAAGAPTQQTFVEAWHKHIVPHEAELVMGFSERAAIDNLKRGLLPPASGNDNPQHYDDSAAVRAVLSGLYYVGQPERAATLAQADAEISNAEDGIYAARAMAAAVSMLAGGASLAEAMAAARAEFPATAWIAHGDEIACACLAESQSPLELTLQLTRRLINTVYTFGNAAPETVPAALVLCESTGGDLHAAILAANAIPKSADSLPSLVGAVCGALQGAQVVPEAWRAALNEAQGLCVPVVAGMQLDKVARALAAL
jgi:ADP-ribosylglycohydrolase